MADQGESLFEKGNELVRSIIAVSTNYVALNKLKAMICAGNKPPHSILFRGFESPDNFNPSAPINAIATDPLAALEYLNSSPITGGESIMRNTAMFNPPRMIRTGFNSGTNNSNDVRP